MQHLLDDVSQLLAEEYRVYERLFDASRAEQSCLVESDANRLDHTLVEVRELVSRAQSIAERRTVLLCRLSEQTGIPAEQLTLTRLAEMAGGPAGVRFDRMRKEFQGLMSRLHKLNGTNLLLIRNSLDMNDRTARLILGETGQVHFYGDTGAAEAPLGPRIVSRRM